ncbi:MAG: hypothetical protein MUF16_00150 [Burkholderiaceae bacterium]|jgi:hypothetical protein|nr:hypothetical protein [Burkholderiaceae bacterium]
MIRAAIAWWRGAWSAGQARPAPMRVGLLDTGELVLLDSHGNAHVLSPETTERIRDTLWLADAATPPRACRCSCDGGTDTADAVHRILAEARA